MIKKITIVLFVLFTTAIMAQTATVNGTSYGTIADAYAAATGGDTIFIDGIFDEKLTSNKAVSLQGDDPDTDGIVFTGTGRVLFYTNQVSGDFNISNLTISGGNTTANGAGILVDKSSSSQITLNNLIVENNSTTASGGGISLNTANVNVTNCIFRNNSAKNGGGIHAVSANGSGSNGINKIISISNTLIHNNNATLVNGSGGNAAGFYIYAGASNKNLTVNIENTTIAFNSAAGSGGSGYCVGAVNTNTSASNVELNMTYVTSARNTASQSTTPKKNNFGVYFLRDAGTVSQNPVFNAYNSIFVAAGVPGNRGINFAFSNPQNFINNVVGGQNAKNLIVNEINNIYGRTAGQIGVPSSLSDQGGFSNVLALNSGDAIDYCTSDTGTVLPSVDQRNYIRNNFPSDAGAFELGATPPPPTGPTLDFTFCSEEMPLEFNPPFLASAGVVVADSGYPSDTGIIGTGLGEYVLESVVINVEGGSAQDLLFALQPANLGGATWILGAFAGGTDGTDTAVDLTFTDASTNNYSDWTGGAPAADYFPAQGAFNTALSGLDINGEWFLIVQGNGNDAATVNSFCMNWAMSSGDAPEIFCPADFAADNDEGVCGAVVNFAPPIALDTEDGPLDPANIVQTGGLPTGSEFPVGDNDVTFTATDSHGNETSCTFVITVNDAEPAMAVCQAVTVTLDASGSASIDASALDGGSTDNCGVDSFAASQTTFSCADVGDVTVTLSVFDAAGNVATCEATVTVIDDTAPVIACIGSPGATEYMEEFEGASVPADWSTTINSGSWDWTFGSGVMPASDDFASNAAIFDDDAAGLGEVNNASLNSPVWNTVGAEGITMSYDYSLDELGAGETLAVDVYDGTDWVNVVTYEDEITPTNSGDIDGSAFANADFQVRFTYDDAGSWGWAAGVDNFMITVNTPPQPPLELELNADGTLSIPAGDLIMDVDEACGYSITSGGSSACDITTETNGLENGLFNNGAPFWVAQQVVFETSMNVTGFELNLFHDPGATIDNVLFVFYEDAGGVPGAVIGGEDLTPVAQTVIGNNFGFDVSTVSTVPTASTIEAGTYWIGTLATSSTAGVTAWEVSTASDALNAHNTQDGITWGDVGAGAAVYSLTGTCGSSDPNNFNFDCSNLGENVVEVFVTDDSGNVSSCSATVIISDVTAPVLVCGPGDGATTVTVDFDGSSAPAGWSVSNAFGDWDWTFGASGAGAPGGTEPFASNAAIFDDDAAGNGNVNNASLFTPVWDMSEATTVTMSYDYSFNELGAGETLAVDVYDGAAWQNVVTYDTDVLTPENSGVIDGTALANAEFQVRFTYDDGGSWGWNAGIDNFQIDFANPPANQDIVTIQLGPDGTAELEAMDFLSEATDACGIDVLIADLEMVTCDDIGAPIEVTIFASDASGNISSCTIDVEVVDTMAPVLTCPEDVSVMVDPDGTHTVADYIGSGEATATDNCTDPVTDFTQDPAPGTVLGVGEWVVTFTATDDSGNVSTCEMNLDLTLLGNQDNELSNAIALYPNPAGEQVTISNSSNIALETAMIYDLNGKLVSQINLQDMQSERVIDVSSYATGVYMVQITGEQSSVVKRMIKE